MSKLTENQINTLLDGIGPPNKFVIELSDDVYDRNFKISSYRNDRHLQDTKHNDGLSFILLVTSKKSMRRLNKAAEIHSKTKVKENENNQ
jgi:hypothetical protein